MAQVFVEAWVALEDYFSKYGFGDGDDGASTDLGFQYRATAIDIVNEALKKWKLPFLAQESDTSSIHNNCRIDVVHKSGSSIRDYLEIDMDDGKATLSVQNNEGEEDEKLADKVKAALEEAHKNFEKVLTKKQTVRCKFCKKKVPAITAHRHDRGYVGTCCWDERLRATE